MTHAKGVRGADLRFATFIEGSRRRHEGEQPPAAQARGAAATQRVAVPGPRLAGADQARRRPCAARRGLPGHRRGPDQCLGAGRLQARPVRPRGQSRSPTDQSDPLSAAGKRPNGWSSRQIDHRPSATWIDFEQSGAVGQLRRHRRGARRLLQGRASAARQPDLQPVAEPGQRQLRGPLPGPRGREAAVAARGGGLRPVLLHHPAPVRAGPRPPRHRRRLPVGHRGLLTDGSRPGQGAQGPAARADLRGRERGQVRPGRLRDVLADPGAAGRRRRAFPRLRQPAAPRPLRPQPAPAVRRHRHPAPAAGHLPGPGRRRRRDPRGVVAGQHQRAGLHPHHRAGAARGRDRGRRQPQRRAAHRRHRGRVGDRARHARRAAAVLAHRPVDGPLAAPAAGAGARRGAAPPPGGHPAAADTAQG